MNNKLFNKRGKNKIEYFFLICYLLSLLEGNNVASAYSMQHCSKNDQNKLILSTPTIYALKVMTSPF